MTSITKKKKQRGSLLAIGFLSTMFLVELFKLEINIGLKEGNKEKEVTTRLTDVAPVVEAVLMTVNA